MIYELEIEALPGEGEAKPECIKEFNGERRL